MFKLKKNSITLDTKYETRSEAETAILDLITAEAKKISDASVAIKNTKDGWDLFVNGRIRCFFGSLRCMHMPRQIPAGTRNAGMIPIWKMHYYTMKSR